MKVRPWVLRSKKLIEDNSPAILTGIGVAGTVITAYLAGKASFKAARAIDAYEEKNEQGEPRYPLDFKKKARLTWHFYVPTLAAAAVTGTSICMARRIDGKRIAAATAAYAITENAFKEFKDKAVEMTSAGKVQKIHDAVMQDKVDKTDGHTLVVMADSDVLCMDAWSGRYFSSTMQKLKTAENDQAYEINHAMYVSLTNYYTLVGLDATSNSDNLGWDSTDKFTITYTTTLKDDKPVIVVNFDKAPHNI